MIFRQSMWLLLQFRNSKSHVGIECDFLSVGLNRTDVLFDVFFWMHKKSSGPNFSSSFSLTLFFNIPLYLLLSSHLFRFYFLFCCDFKTLELCPILSVLLGRNFISTHVGWSPTEDLKGLRGSLKLYSGLGSTILLEFSEFPCWLAKALELQKQSSC